MHGEKMKNRIISVACVAAFTAITCSYASAEPSFRVIPHSDGGKTIEATNPEGKGYSCTASWVISGEEFDQPRSVQRTVNFYVQPQAKNEPVVNAGGEPLTQISSTFPTFDCH
jgi:hypothetical protein